MTIVAYDRVAESSASVGVGDLVFAGALNGFRTYASVLADLDQFTYAIQDSAGGAYFETGIGRYNAGANSLTRLEIISSSNANAVVNLPVGTKNILLTITSRQIRPTGAFPFTIADGLAFRWNAKYSRTDIDTTGYASKLYDISGNARHSDTQATQGSRPKWYDTAFNRRFPCISFTGARRMTISALPARGSPLVVSILFTGQNFKQQGANSHIYNWGGNPIGFGSTDPLSFMYNGTLPAAHTYPSQADVAFDMQSHPVGSIHVYNGAASVQSINRLEQVVSPGITATGGTNFFTLGSDSASSPGNFSKYFLWDLTIVFAALTLAQRTAYFDYLAAEVDLKTS